MATDEKTRTTLLEDATDEANTPSGIAPLQTLYVNQFWLGYWPDRLKISFGEAVNNETIAWRTAVLLPLAEARLLSERLLEAIRDMEATPPELDSED